MLHSCLTSASALAFILICARAAHEWVWTEACLQNAWTGSCAIILTSTAAAHIIASKTIQRQSRFWTRACLRKGWAAFCALRNAEVYTACCRVDLTRVALAHPHVPQEVGQRLGMPMLADVITERLDPNHPLQSRPSIQVPVCLCLAAVTRQVSIRIAYESGIVRILACLGTPPRCMSDHHAPLVRQSCECNGAGYDM